MQGIDAFLKNMFIRDAPITLALAQKPGGLIP
jgi:hypothetical protein